MQRAQTDEAAEWLQHEYTAKARELAKAELEQAHANLRSYARVSSDPRVSSFAAIVDRYEEFWKFLGGRP